MSVSKAVYDANPSMYRKVAIKSGPRKGQFSYYKNREVVGIAESIEPIMGSKETVVMKRVVTSNRNTKCKDGKVREGKVGKSGIKRCVKKKEEVKDCPEGKVRAGKMKKDGVKRCIKDKPKKEPKRKAMVFTREDFEKKAIKIVEDEIVEKIKEDVMKERMRQLNVLQPDPVESSVNLTEIRSPDNAVKRNLAKHDALMKQTLRADPEDISSRKLSKRSQEILERATNDIAYRIQQGRASQSEINDMRKLGYMN